MRKILITIFILILPTLVLSTALMPMADPEQGSALPGNFVVDIIDHNGAVWLATGSGVAFSYYGDSVWNYYDRSNGLAGELISGIYSNGDELWVSMNTTVVSSDLKDTASDGNGLAHTSDDGFTWIQDSVIGTHGVAFNVFDITGRDSMIFCASQLGGLIGSFDHGENWQKIYFSYSDSISDSVFSESLDLNDLTRSQYYYSAAVDSLHGDTLVLWAGTASGVMRYSWLPDYVKPASEYIFDIVNTDGFVFVCGDHGLTRMGFAQNSISDTIQYYTAFMRDGLPGMAVTTAYGFADRLFVGTIDSVALDSSYKVETLYNDGFGLAVSDDSGLTFYENYSGLDDLNGLGRYPVEFASIGHNLFMAAAEAGLFVSSDTGLTWSRIALDTLDASFINPKNIVNSISADSLNLWVGTDTGLVVVYFDDSGNDTLHWYIPFEDKADMGARVHKVSHQFYLDTLGSVDSTLVWVLNHPIDSLVGSNSVYFSNDTGQTWNESRPYVQATEIIPYYDIDYWNDFPLLVGEDLFSVSLDRFNWTKYDGSYLKDATVTPNISLNGLDLTAIVAVADTFFIGSANGLAYSPPTGGSFVYYIDRPNKNPLKHDNVTNVRHSTLTGNMVFALGVQDLSDGNGLIWVSSREVLDPDQYRGVNVGSLDGLEWRRITEIEEVWNYAFDGLSVFAATSTGLKFSEDTGATWIDLQISGELKTSFPSVDIALDPNISVYAVEIINNSLWVGTGENGVAVISLDDIESGNYDAWSIYRTLAENGAYAYPIPYSFAGHGNGITFHYEVPESGANVSLKIYDFAMNHVATVIDDVWHDEGSYTSDTEPAGNKWYGLVRGNARVAVGVYYFNVELSTGESYWGKLAIIP